MLSSILLQRTKAWSRKEQVEGRMGKLYQLTKSEHKKGRKDQKERRQPNNKGKRIMEYFSFGSSKSGRQKLLKERRYIREEVKESNFESE